MGAEVCDRLFVLLALPLVGTLGEDFLLAPVSFLLPPPLGEAGVGRAAAAARRAVGGGLGRRRRRRRRRLREVDERRRLVVGAALAGNQPQLGAAVGDKVGEYAQRRRLRRRRRALAAVGRRRARHAADGELGELTRARRRELAECDLAPQLDRLAQLAPVRRAVVAAEPQQLVGGCAVARAAVVPRRRWAHVDRGRVARRCRRARLRVRLGRRLGRRRRLRRRRRRLRPPRCTF